MSALCKMSGCNYLESKCSGECLHPHVGEAKRGREDIRCSESPVRPLGEFDADTTLDRMDKGAAEMLAIVHGLPAPSALDVQVAGSHYKGKKIQPVEFIHANGLNFLEGCIVKRITRWRDKPAADRFQDLEKIKHEVDLLIEMESKHGRD